MDEQEWPAWFSHEQEEENELVEQEAYDEEEEHPRKDIDDHFADGAALPCAEKGIQAARDAYMNVQKIKAPETIVSFYRGRFQKLVDEAYPRKSTKQATNTNDR